MSEMKPELLRDGTLLYELETVNDRHGRTVQRNRYSIQVVAGPGMSYAEAEALAERVRQAMATPPTVSAGNVLPPQRSMTDQERAEYREILAGAFTPLVSAGDAAEAERERILSRLKFVRAWWATSEHDLLWIDILRAVGTDAPLRGDADKGET